MLAAIWIDIALIYAVASIHSRNAATSAHIDNAAASVSGDYGDSSSSRLPFFKLLIKPWSRFWKCLWTTIGFTMGMITPILIIGFLTIRSGASPVIVAILYAFTSIYVLQFYTRYLFAITSAALESKVTGVYAYSEKLVRGHFGRVFVAVLIIIVVSSLISIVGLLSRITPETELIAIRLGLTSLDIQLIAIGYEMFAKPLITAFTVLLYFRLKEIKAQILKASQRPVRRISNL